jgi:ribosomal protein S18 acetylase RimI-like enzyme
MVRRIETQREQYPLSPTLMRADMLREAGTVAKMNIPYLRNNGGMRNIPGFGAEIEPWGRYMSEDPAPHGPPTRENWERGNVSFENPLFVPHNYGSWKQELSQDHGGLTGKELSRALLDKGHDGIITHDKYGIGEMVDIRPKNQREHTVASTAALDPEFEDDDPYERTGNLGRVAGARGDLPKDITFQHHPMGSPSFPDVIEPSARVDPSAFPAVSAHVGDQMVGHIQWHGDHPRKKGEIWDVRVHPDFRRRGVADALYDWTTDQVEPDLHHSGNLSDDGAGWRANEEQRPITQQRYDAWSQGKPMPKRFASRTAAAEPDLQEP